MVDWINSNPISYRHLSFCNLIQIKPYVSDRMSHHPQFLSQICYIWHVLKSWSEFSIFSIHTSTYLLNFFFPSNFNLFPCMYFKFTPITISLSLSFHFLFIGTNIKAGTTKKYIIINNNNLTFNIAISFWLQEFIFNNWRIDFCIIDQMYSENIEMIY